MLRITLVATSARVAPGVLTAWAWDLLRSVPVFCGTPDHPQRAALAEASVPVEVVDVEVVDVEVGLHGGVVGEAAGAEVSGQPATGAVPAVSEAFVAAMRARAQDVGVTDVAWLLEPAHALPSPPGVAGHAGRGRPDSAGEAGVASVDTADVEIRVLAGTRELPGSALLDAVAVMDRLRSPGGCPWDAEQTHATLAPYLLEEAYEAYQAIEDGNLAELREELGDVLLQVLFHARVAAEGTAGERDSGGEQVGGGSGGGSGWDVDAVAAGLVAKLVRRHPHVFGEVTVAGADEVVTNWQAIKDAEKGRVSVTDGIPVSLPALSLARKLLTCSARLGISFDVAAGDAGTAWGVKSGTSGDTDITGTAGETSAGTAGDADNAGNGTGAGVLAYRLTAGEPGDVDDAGAGGSDLSGIIAALAESIAESAETAGNRAVGARTGDGRVEGDGQPAPDLDSQPVSDLDGNVGNLLFAAVALADAAGVDPEAALRRTARAFRDRVVALEWRAPGDV